MGDEHDLSGVSVGWEGMLSAALIQVLGIFLLTNYDSLRNYRKSGSVQLILSRVCSFAN